MKPIIITYKQEYSFRERMLLFLLGKVIPIHARFYGKRQPWGLTREDLIRYPAGSLGHELGQFLSSEGLQPVPRVERHDAFHILLDYTTRISDEAAMQFFLVGNGKRSPFTLGTMVFAAFVLPELWELFRREFRRGRQARSIARWNFYELLHENFSDLKKIIFNQPVENPALLRRVMEMENRK